MKQRVKLINGKIPVIGGDTINKISPYEIDVAFLNDFGSNKNLLAFYKIIFNYYLSIYEQIIGKNQEEAYQWATANGHFASIVKK